MARHTGANAPLHWYALTAFTYLSLAVLVAAVFPVMLVLVALTHRHDRHRILSGKLLRRVAVLVARSFPLWSVRVEGRWPADGRAYVVVANHTSHADILLLSHLPREMKWWAKVDGFRLPLLGWLFHLAGDLPVHQGDAAAARRTLERATRYLRGGTSVMIFPEGKRSAGTLLPFRTGAFRLALQTGTPLLPVALTGAADALPRDGWLLRPAALTARILDPVEVTGLGEGEHARLRDLVRGRILEALRAEPELAAGAAPTLTPVVGG